MNSQPLVSVCIPTYNGERYLRQCLESAINQTYSKLEVLVVDDCSTDSTAHITQQFASRDKRIRALKNDHNLGLVGNWNRCIELAHGEWIKFAFQDDFLQTDCIEKMLSAATRPIVFCDRCFLFEAGTSEHKIVTYNQLPRISSLYGDSTEIEPERIQDAVLKESKNFFGEPTAALLHRSLFERFGWFNTSLAQFCDLEYWIRVTIHTGLSYIKEPLATFRYHGSSTSASNAQPLHEERTTLFDRVIMLHEFAYNPLYAPLRLKAKRGATARDFSSEFIEKATWAHARAKALANHVQTPDASWLIHWNKLAIQYPRFEHSVSRPSFRLKNLWTRHLGWRLKD